MKKLIVATMLVYATAFTYGAAVDWTASGILDAAATAAAGKNTAGNGWLGYMIMATDYATVTADLAAGKTSSLVSKAVGPVKTTNNKATFSAATATGNVASGAQDFYLVVLNAGTASAATQYYVSAKATETIDASLDTTVAFGSQVAGTKVADNWGSLSGGGGDVPEPTSAMLMLLGVAGLALRRKQK